MKREGRFTVRVFLSAATLCAICSYAAAGTILVSSPHYLGYGYGGDSWTHFTNALNVASGNQVSVASDFSNLSQMLSYDALLLPPRQPGATMSATELSNIQSFIGTGRRAILMGENDSWTAWDNQILGLFGRSFAGVGVGTASAVLSNTLTAGAPTIYLPYCGLANGGTALYSKNVATLWGTNSNVLTMLNINVWDDNDWSTNNNAQFAVNAANWLASPVPEPSTVALLGVGVIGLVAFAWRRARQPG